MRPFCLVVLLALASPAHGEADIQTTALGDSIAQLTDGVCVDALTNVDLLLGDDADASISVMGNLVDDYGLSTVSDEILVQHYGPYGAANANLWPLGLKAVEGAEILMVLDSLEQCSVTVTSMEDLPEYTSIQLAMLNSGWEEPVSISAASNDRSVAALRVTKRLAEDQTILAASRRREWGKPTFQIVLGLNRITY